MLRSARVTLRCLTEDLELDIPPLEAEVGTVDHPIMAEAWRLAPVAEDAQDRILAITSPLIYKLRHGRWRGATWLDRSDEIFWLLGGAIRKEGSASDPYVRFVALHEADRLLPGKDDALRIAAEKAASFLGVVRSALRDELQSARATPREDHRFYAAGLALRFHIRRNDEWEEIWLAIRTIDVDGNGVKETTRDTVFALLEELVGEAEWEYQARWPTGPLHGCEMVKWGLAATGRD